MVSKVRGQFEQFTVDVDFNEVEPTRSSVHVQIDAASINTKDQQRDGHLKSPDFLDVETYPYITFNSKRIEKIKRPPPAVSSRPDYSGDHREVALDVDYAGMLRNPWGMMITGASAQTRINRKDWDLTWNQALETGGVLVSEELTINIELELVKQPEPSWKQPDLAYPSGSRTRLSGQRRFATWGVRKTSLFQGDG